MDRPKFRAWPDVERLDRQRQFHGGQPDVNLEVRNISEVATAIVSRLVTQDHCGCGGPDFAVEANAQYHGRSASTASPARLRGAQRSAPRGAWGGQRVPGVATWKGLTDSVNSMAGNLTAQVRNIAEVTTAVARGDLSRKITVDVKGEILELKHTINTMVDQLNAFASEVNGACVWRWVLLGQAWRSSSGSGGGGHGKDLTDNVNFMASNLTGAYIARSLTEVLPAAIFPRKSRLTLGAKSYR